jgi:hypothetical protein
MYSHESLAALSQYFVVEAFDQKLSSSAVFLYFQRAQIFKYSISNLLGNRQVGKQELLASYHRF